MSVQAITWALKQKTGSPSAKAILLALANYAGSDGDCYPSQERLSDDTEQSVDSVQRRLRELETAGFIYRQHRQGKRGWRRSDEFVILMDDACRARAASLGWAPDVGQEARSTTVRLRHIETNTANCGEGDGEIPTPQIAASNTANRPVPKPHLCGTEPKQEPSQEPPPTPQGGSWEEGAALAIWTKFEAAWGFDDPTDRIAPARKTFSRMTLEEAQAAIAAAPRYRDECRVRSRKRCHARTWLTERGWESFASARPDEAKLAQVFIAKGTQQAAAWARHYASTGRKMFMTEMNAPGGRRVGRYEPTEWPPSGSTHRASLLCAAATAIATMPEDATP